MNVIDQALRNFRLLFRYGISGAIGLLVNLAVVYIATHFLGIWYMASATLAFFISFIVAFLLQKYWTFKDNDHNKIPKQATTYFLINIASLLINLGILYVLVERYGLWYLGSQAFALVVIASFSFLLNVKINFKIPNEEEDLKK